MVFLQIVFELLQNLLEDILKISLKVSIIKTNGDGVEEAIFDENRGQ
jgi:hypothetical protein